MPAQIAFNKTNAIDLYKRYYGKVADFLTDIVRMDLDDWQRELCDKFHEEDRFAVSSGHSSGKSALTAGIIIYFLTIHPQPKATITANTKSQLTTKTWRELAVWHQRSLIKDWFVWTATKFHLKGEAATWFAAAIPQSEHNSEAFAGDHEKYMLQIFDEASNIPRIIYEVAEGATATEGGYRKWLLFGNPTQSSGAFYNACFGRQKHRWYQIVIDTRECKYADQEQIEKWIEDYGIDSDFVRVRVLGLPPKQSMSGLINPEAVASAMSNRLPESAYRHSAKILSIDCAQFGDDDSVWCYRQGLKVHKFDKKNGLDEMGIARHTITAIESFHPQAVMMDVTGGYGSGAFSRLKELGYTNIFPVNFSCKSDENPDLYQNKRFEMYENARKWLEDYKPDLPYDQNFEEELVAQELIYNRQTGRKQLLAKVDLKKVLGRSCDTSDSFAISFAYPVHGSEEAKPKTEAEKDWLKVTGFGDDDESACNVMA